MCIMAQFIGTRWCFTVNAPSASEKEDAIEYLNKHYQHLADCEDPCVAICMQGECGTNYHIQGYIEFAHEMTRKEVKAFIGCRSVHVEKAKASWKQNLIYTTKQDTSVPELPPVVWSADYRCNSATCEAHYSTWCDACKDRLKGDLHEYMEEFWTSNFELTGAVRSRTINCG